MKNGKTKPLSIIFLILCMTSFFGGGGVSAVAAAPESRDIYVNINNSATTFTAAEMLESMGVTDFTDTDRQAAYFTEVYLYDEVMTAVDFIGTVGDNDPANTVKFTQKRAGETGYRSEIGTTKMRVKMFVGGREVEYNVNVRLVAAVLDDAQSAVIRIGIGSDSDEKAQLFRNTATLVDFVNNETDAVTAYDNLLFLKNQLRNKLGILNLGYNGKVLGEIGGNGIVFHVNQDGVEVTDSKPDSSAPDSTVEIVGETGKGFTFRVNGDYASRVVVPVVFQDDPKQTLTPKSVTVQLVFDALANPVSSEPIVKEIDSLKVTCVGIGAQSFSLTDFFNSDTIQAGSKIRLTDQSVTELTQTVSGSADSYNPAKVNVSVLTDNAGIQITPKGNGYTCISMDYTVTSVSGSVLTGHLAVPVEVTGVYTFGNVETIVGVDTEFSAYYEKFRAAYDDGYVFYSVEEAGDAAIAEVKVENGKLTVLPKAAGTTSVQVKMINPQLDNPEDNLITVSVPIHVDPFNLFAYLSTAGIITLFTTIGVIAAIIVILIMLAMLRHRKNKKLKRQIMRAAESKLLQKQEIQARQRASMMPFQSMMFRSQGLALNAAGSASQSARGSSVMPQQSQAKPLLELNTAENSIESGNKSATKAGTKKTDAFMEEAITRVRRESDDRAKREQERKKQEEQRLKRETEAARRAAKIKQQQALEEEQRKRETVMQQQLENERGQLEAEKQKMQQEQDETYLDGKRAEAIDLNASLLDLYRQLASIDKLLFVKDMELAKVNKNAVLSKDSLEKAEHEEDKERIAGELRQLVSDAETFQSEISELEGQAGADDARRIKEESHIDAIVADCKFDDLKAEFERQRADLMREIEEEYERYTKGFKNEFNTKDALEQAEKLRRDMIAQTERTKRENLRKAIETKLATINDIIADTQQMNDPTALAQTEGKLNGVIAALLPDEETQEVDDKVAEAQQVIQNRRDALERELADAASSADREKRGAAEKEAREFAVRMAEIAKRRLEFDKQTYLNNFNKNRAEAKLRVTRERLATAQSDGESVALNEELQSLNDTLGRLNAELAAVEMQSDAENNIGAELESKMDALVRENGLADVKKEIDYQSGILQKDINNEYQKFVAKHKEDVQRQDGIEEAERMRRQMREQAKKIKREAFHDLIKSKKKTLSNIAEEIKLADTVERLAHYEANLKDFEATLRDEEKIPEIMNIVNAAHETGETRRKEIARVAKQRVEAAYAAEESTAKIKIAVEAKRRELLGIKGEISTVTDKKSADALLAKLAAFTDDLTDELRVPEVMVPVDKVYDSIVHAGEMAELRNTKAPQKKVIKKVVNNINRVKRPASKTPGEAGARPAAARPAGARPTAAGARPAGSRPPRPAGTGPAAARPAGARPIGARPAGSRPAARPAARPIGSRPAPKR